MTKWTRVKTLCFIAVLGFMAFITIYTCLGSAESKNFKIGLIISTCVFALFYLLLFIFDISGLGNKKIIYALYVILPIIWFIVLFILYLFLAAKIGFR